MKMLLSSLVCLLAAAGPVAAEPAPDQRRGDQVEAFDQLKKGRLLPLHEIERRVVPQMRGAQYLGVELDSISGIYTLKFLRDGNVIWVEVDGRSGQVIGRTGN
ncbi:PepSY domain-containing protein [Sphingomonas alpina]|uniref:PepSY domain-containing protein n=1 Tax=Sphingomonas alpina TaxID=653931 RepID=A0A7H0LK89_9SPHN|nr:hypothetical protein [Sphingomonas alpina]QNQ10092.1 hypothetical protein H3Z74_02240 [Sphingomonas alpina]